MATLYVDINCADDTGTAESPYFTALLGSSTNGYQQFETGALVNILTADDTIHVAPGAYTATTLIGGTNFRRTFVIYGTVSIDGSTAGNVNALECKFAGWLYFTAGNSAATFIVKNYTSAVTKQMLYGTPGKFDFRGVKCVLSNSPNGEGVRLFDNSVGAYANPNNHFDELIMHNLDRGVRVDGTANGHNMTIVNLLTYDVNRPVYLASSDFTVDIGQALFGLSDSYHVYGEGAWAGTCNIHNSISVGGTAPHNNVSPFFKAVGTGTVNVNNSFIAPSPQFANTTSGTVDTSVTDDEPIMATTFMEGSISFNIDDSKNFTAFQALVTEADLRGLKVGWAIDWTQRDMNAERWAFATTAHTNGHGIYIHTRHSANMESQFAFRVQYTGTGLAASLDIAGTSLTTTVDTVTDIDIDLTTFDSVGALVTHIDALANYSAETFDQDETRIGTILGATSTKYAAEPTTSMFGTQNKADIKTAATDVSHNQALFFTEEITGCINDIQQNTGVTPTSMVYPGGKRNPLFDETIEGYGVNIARDSLPVTGSEKYYPFDIDPLGQSAYPIDQIAPTTDSEAVRRRKLLGFFEWIKNSGAIFNLWQHDLIAYSQAQWAVVLDAAVESGVTVATLDEQSVAMRNGTRSVASGQISYSQPILDNLIVYAQNADVIDGFIGDDTGKKWWTGPNPTGVDGEPFSDFDTSVGRKQSKEGPFHPVNL